MIPVLNDHFQDQVKAVEDLILSEVNVKNLEFLKDDSGIISKKIKANFKALGPRYGKMMKKLAPALNNFSKEQIAELEDQGKYNLDLEGETIEILISDVEILTEDIPGWQVANEGALTIALDVTLTDELINEGIARDFVNKVQLMRKSNGYEVTDRIRLQVENSSEKISLAIQRNFDYICSETLAKSLDLVDIINGGNAEKVEFGEELETRIHIDRVV
jgi:isoleucyl-tRNA synthetase